jgi:sigma-E factor negative regulatory protein RseB
MKRAANMHAALAAGAAVFLTLAGTWSAAAPPRSEASRESSPERLLSRMTQAQSQLEYEGTLVYLHGRQLSTLRIAHRIDDGQWRESLLALTGPVRAVARSDRGVTCMLPDSRTISLPSADGGNTLLPSGPFDFDRIRSHYLLRSLGQSRVAGRDTDVVGIVPLDNYRYGYRFFIDQSTGLALKIDLMDNASDPIEQVMFTDVSIERDNVEQVPIHSPAAGAHAPRATQSAGTASDSSAHGDWRLTALPPGFRVVMHGAGPDPSADGGTRHIVVSDGLASLSVYIEPAGQDGLNGATRMGATTAVGRKIAGRQVTVVGEVPESTALMILDGLQPLAD